MEIADRLRRVWLVLYRAYRTLYQRGVITEAELEEAVSVLEHLDELTPEQIRSRLLWLGRRTGGDGGPDAAGADGGGR